MTKPASLLNKLPRPRRGPLRTHPNFMPEDEWIVSGRFVHHSTLSDAAKSVRGYRPKKVPDDATPEFWLRYPVLFAAVRGAAHRMRRAFDEADWPTFKREDDQFRLAVHELRDAYALPLAGKALHRTVRAKSTGKEGAEERWGIKDRERRDDRIRAAMAARDSSAEDSSVEGIAKRFKLSVSRIYQIANKKIVK